MIIDIKGTYVEWEMARFQRSQSFSVEKGQAKEDYLSNRDRWERKNGELWEELLVNCGELWENMGKGVEEWGKMGVSEGFCRRMF